MKNWLASCFLLLFLFSGNSQEQKTYTWNELNGVHPDSVLALDCSKMKWKELPKELFQYKQLRYLNISKNELTELPDAFGELDSLRVIDCSRNKISAMGWICQFPHLKRIHASRNQISNLPECIGNLHQLTVLDLWDNPIERLPESLVKCAALKTVDLRGILFNLNFQEAWMIKMPDTKWFFDAPCNCVGN